MNDPIPEILWVRELNDEFTHLVGSKMARLGQLRSWGLNVPEGFGLTKAAYERFLEESKLEKIIEEKLAGIRDATDADAIDQCSRELRVLIEAAQVPKALNQTITEAYSELCYSRLHLNQPVAVRSSAIGEDAKNASFAGQFDTYLGLSGKETVLDGIKRCWSSLFTRRGITYRLKNGLSHRDSPMAVCVLELINARASGVAFSIHPVTGNRDRIVIEGNWGWGEAVVQGLVTPDHVEVGKADGRVLSYDAREKLIVSTFDYAKGKVVEQEMPQRWRQDRVLDDEQIRSIHQAVCTIEEKYGMPVDVEWVVPRAYRSGDPVIIVQTRPETVHSKDEQEKPKPAWDPVAMASKYAFGKKRSPR
jgi:pyruvate,water dikinase